MSEALPETADQAEPGADPSATTQTSALGKDRGAVISPCGTYRYHLWRRVDGMGALRGDGRCVFIMLNPSTADADRDDPTIRKCVGFARRWGYAWISVVNLFAFRATDPRALRGGGFVGGMFGGPAYKVGPENDDHIATVCGMASLVVCAWGTHGDLYGRDQAVLRQLRTSSVPCHYLRLTKAGLPSHPLMLPYSLTPTEWI